MTTADSTPVPDYLAQLRLDGRSYVVVGAGQGMGRQTCHALAQAGAAKLVCVDIDGARADEIAAEVGIGVPWAGDVTDRAVVARLAADAERELGTIDGFVDIVGMARWAGILELDDETWDWEFDICLRHAYLLSQELGRRMVATGGGTMVFIASASGLSGAPNHAAYGAAKAALIAWVQSLAVELGPQGVRANAVAPGVILTPRMDAAFDDERRKANTEVVPIKRMGRPADIAGAVLFLTSDLSSFVSGRTLLVDGGVDAKFPYTPL
ncbi:MAG TPA: SDR family oxidoreductase [Acidimicrobiales bacterium]|jgi:NAD(P)-dependent dehydrogenase (short-subunit alcohol dehydrogenase family)|nr:SDR family oxidoreductase [Acidimicrobiales bacterium]